MVFDSNTMVIYNFHIDPFPQDYQNNLEICFRFWQFLFFRSLSLIFSVKLFQGKSLISLSIVIFQNPRTMKGFSFTFNKSFFINVEKEKLFFK